MKETPTSPNLNSLISTLADIKIVLNSKLLFEKANKKTLTIKERIKSYNGEILSNSPIQIKSAFNLLKGTNCMFVKEIKKHAKSLSSKNIDITL